MPSGMETLTRLAPLAEQAMQFYRDGDMEAARHAGEDFWRQIPQPPLTDGDRLAAQLSLTIARRALAVSTPDAAHWLRRARTAYGEDSLGGMAQCDVVAGCIALDEDRAHEARNHFDKAVAVLGPKALDTVDAKYRAFYDDMPQQTHPGHSVEELSELGERLSDAGKFDEAISTWQDALSQTEADDADTQFWLHASIGDAQFHLADYRAALASEQNALVIGGTGNPFVWLRLGQAAFELGDTKKATDALLSAYMLEGDDIFEDEDPKYRQSLVEQGLIA